MVFAISLEPSPDELEKWQHLLAVADPEFPVGGRRPHSGRGLPRRLRFENFVCQNERIWTLEGGGLRRASANVDPPMPWGLSKWKIVITRCC